MNDDATLAAVRNHLTQVRGSLGGVHMNTPANEIVARASWPWAWDFRQEARSGRYTCTSLPGQWTPTATEPSPSMCMN